ncbi:MAG: pilus assembly protein [Peptococcaceae bacterium BICA1-7]|nr:MAG: pilus assembly protein [Peptococcaceae bacterium BICA1-7]HBV98708.1 CpaF family protein [Desulfotomaculum sp.]
MRIADEIELVNHLKEEVTRRIDLGRDLSDDEIVDVITEVVFEASRGSYIDIKRKKSIIGAVFNSMRRLDAIQPLLEDGSVTEIMVNSHEEIFVERNGVIERLDIKLESCDKLLNIIQSIVARVNRTVNQSSPIVDARLPDGSRVSVVLPPVALKGPTMTIRKFPEAPFTIEGLVAGGTLSGEAAEFLGTLVRAKYNIFISGGTGSGKTTFLNALSNFIPSGERVITIEDSAELQLKNIKNLVGLETRNSNTEGKGEITIRDLIKTSLRMRPDRIIVGEVRGAEALDMLQAMNTGHDGSLSTGHANTTRDMLSRLETMVLSGAPFPVEVIRKQIASAIDIVIHLARIRDGSRRVMEIAEVSGYSNGEIMVTPLYKYREEGEAGGRVLGSLEKVNSLAGTLKMKLAGMEVIPDEGIA